MVKIVSTQFFINIFFFLLSFLILMTLCRLVFILNIGLSYGFLDERVYHIASNGGA